MPVHARSAADPIRTSLDAGGSGGASFNSGSVAPTSDHSCWSVSSARAPCRCSAVRWTTSTWAQRHQTSLSPERLCVRCSSQAYDSSTVASRLGSHCASKQQIGPHGGCQFGIVLRPELGAQHDERELYHGGEQRPAAARHTSLGARRSQKAGCGNMRCLERRAFTGTSSAAERAASRLNSAAGTLDQG